MLLNSCLIMINNTFLIFRSISFWLNLVISVLLFGPIAFLAGILSYSTCLKISKLWCRYNLYFLKLVCSLSYTYDGPRVDSFQLIISRHQSAWETIFLAAYAEKPIFILKKELLRIPLFGWCLFLLKNIAIDRSDGVTALKKIMNTCNDHISNKRTLIIFPEGTRVPYGQTGKIKKGIFKIIESLKITSLVLNHDAGKYWSRDSFLIQPGRINIKASSLDYTEEADALNTAIRQHFN